MIDPREKFLTGLNFDAIEIREFPKIAFFCGGNPRAIPDGSSNYFLSVRSYIAQAMTAKYSNIFCQHAEHIKDWNSYNIYSDLIDFESDIAVLCKTIVLFLESPGSTAELGSFSVLSEINNKILVFVNSKHASSSSYIQHGPLKKLKNISESKVHYIDWEMKKTSISGENIDVLDLTKFTNENKDYVCDQINEHVTTSNHKSHLTKDYIRAKEILFLHDLVHLFKAIEASEISNYYALVNHRISSQEIHRALFCLLKLNLIREVLRGDKRFYVPEDCNSQKYLSFKGVDRDSLRLAVNLDAYYKHRIHFLRNQAISESRGSHE